jgi:hypothetical protein
VPMRMVWEKKILELLGAFFVTAGSRPFRATLL